MAESVERYDLDSKRLLTVHKVAIFIAEGRMVMSFNLRGSFHPYTVSSLYSNMYTSPIY